VPILDVTQDFAPYFRIHHTPADTLEAIDRESLRQAETTYKTIVAMAVDGPGSFGRLPVTIDADE
jgi:hypothetical protein